MPPGERASPACHGLNPLKKKSHRCLTVPPTLASAGLARTVKVTVPTTFEMLQNTYPPADATFGAQYADALRSVCEMLRDDGSFFTINIYPWFSYRTDPSRVPLSLALLTESHTVGGVTYDNLLLMRLAAVRAALLRLDATFTGASLPIVVGETGWPTAGHADATVGNAATYVNNVVRLGLDGRADVYLFEAFDGPDEQVGPGTIQGNAVQQQNFGLFRGDGEAKFAIPLLSPRRSSSSEVVGSASSASGSSSGGSSVGSSGTSNGGSGPSSSGSSVAVSSTSSSGSSGDVPSTSSSGSSIEELLSTSSSGGSAPVSTSQSARKCTRDIRPGYCLRSMRSNL